MFCIEKRDARLFDQSREMMIISHHSVKLIRLLLPRLPSNRKERNEASLIDIELAKVKCPQIVIDYLQDKITFISDDSEN